MTAIFRNSIILAIAGLAGSITAMAQEMAITVQLSVPLSAASSRKGDLIAAQVVSPDSMRGDTLQGAVSQVSSARGQSMTAFAFTSLRHGGMTIPVAATIQGVSNSKGAPGVDELGVPLRINNAVVAAAKPVSASRFGGQLGGLIGGRTGQAVSDVGDDVNAPGGPGSTSMQISAQAAGLALAPGATLMLSARTNGNGPSLASLAPLSPAPGAPMPGVPMAPASPAAPMAPAQPAAPQQSQSAGMQPAAAAGAGAAASGGQPELKSTKIEFVPGERTTFFEDFSDMVEDEPPPHWKVRDGTVDLLTSPGIRELHADKNVRLTSQSFEIPVNFTLEAEWTGTGQMVWYLRDKANNNIFSATLRGGGDGKGEWVSVSGPDGGLGDGEVLGVDNSKPMHFSLWAQQGRVRAYLEGQRVVDVNQVKFGPMEYIFLDFAGYRPTGLRQVRVAESAPDFSTVINGTGKYVTHGINFDTDSDRLKPESAAMLKLVAAALTKNPNLKLEIDGYTDSVGKPDHNLDLSKRRAEAVRTVLVSQFGVDADRLTSGGFGADNPIGSNDTPDGRANNRRVEFLKK